MLRFALALISVITLLTVGLNASAIAYDGYKIYEVIPETTAQCNELYEISKQAEHFDFLSLSKIPKSPARVMIAPSSEENFIIFLENNQMKYKILNRNVGITIEQEFQLNRLLRKLKPYTGTGRLSTERYYTFDEINSYIEDLATRFPTRVHIKTVGKSYEERWIKTITITNGDGRTNKNVILMDGGFHAREWISPAAVVYAIEQLVENFDENSDLLLDYDWVILPVVNPDGYEHTQKSTTTRNWRKTRQPYKYLTLTCYGADPNRNFDFHWNEEGASSNPCSDTFAGPNAFSEPETVIVRDLMYSLKGRGMFYLTLHSYGNYLLYPWGWTSDLPDTWKDLDEVARAGADAIFNATNTVYTVGSSTNVLYIAAGASDDYAFHVGFPISITMELPKGGTIGFDPPATAIDGIVKETWIGIRAMAEKVIEKYPTERQHFLR